MGEPDNNLINYVYTYLQQGYEISAITQGLLNQGFSQKQINSAVDFVYANYYYQNQPNPVKQGFTNYRAEPIHKHLGVAEISIFLLIIFGVSLIGIALVFILSSPSDEVLTQNEYSNIDHTLQNENSINSNNNNNNNNINDINNNIQEDQTQINKIKINETKEHENRIIFDEEVQEKKIEEESIIRSITTKESITEPFDSSKEYTQRQIEIKVSYFAENNPSEAKRFCDIITNDISKQYCYLEIASKSGVEGFCEDITSGQIKDDCYRELVFEGSGDEQTCLKVSNDFKQKGCLDFLKIESMKVKLDNSENSNEPINPEDDINYYEEISADFSEI